MIFINLKTRVPWVKIPLGNLDKIYQAFNLTPGSKIIDLGCGDGRFLFYAEAKSRRDGHNYILDGYELSLYPFWRGQFLKLFHASKVTLKNKNFLQADLTKANGIFIFLVERIMPKIALALNTKLKPGTLVVSYAFKLSNWPLIDVLDTKPSPTYIYRKNW